MLVLHHSASPKVLYLKNPAVAHLHLSFLAPKSASGRYGPLSAIIVWMALASVESVLYIDYAHEVPKFNLSPYTDTLLAITPWERLDGCRVKQPRYVLRITSHTTLVRHW